MCGSGKSKATVFQPNRGTYQQQPAPYSLSGTATSAAPIAASSYPQYGNSYQPAQGMSPETAQNLAAMRDAIIGSTSGRPQSQPYRPYQPPVQAQEQLAPMPYTPPQGTQQKKPSNVFEALFSVLGGVNWR